MASKPLKRRSMFYLLPRTVRITPCKSTAYLQLSDSGIVPNQVQQLEKAHKAAMVSLENLSSLSRGCRTQIEQVSKAVSSIYSWMILQTGVSLMGASAGIASLVIITVRSKSPGQRQVVFRSSLIAQCRWYC